MDTREQWLNDMITEIRPIFEVQGSPLPTDIRVSTGIPSTYKRSGALSECFRESMSADGSFQIFISPTIAEPFKVAEQLVHQLCRTTSFGAYSYGAKTFCKVATEMGLVANFNRPKSEIVASPFFQDMYKSIIEGLGAYPHSELTLEGSKTQSTRMLATECETCGYLLRTSKKWLLKAMPICPVHLTEMKLKD